MRDLWYCSDVSVLGFIEVLVDGAFGVVDGQGLDVEFGGDFVLLQS